MNKINFSSKGRLVGLILGLILVVVAVFWVLTRSGSDASSSGGSSIATSNSENQSGPGGTITQQQQNLINQTNEQDCKKMVRALYEVQQHRGALLFPEKANKAGVLFADSSQCYASNGFNC